MYEEHKESRIPLHSSVLNMFIFRTTINISAVDYILDSRITRWMRCCQNRLRQVSLPPAYLAVRSGLFNVAVNC